MDGVPGLSEDFIYIVSFNLDHRSLSRYQSLFLQSKKLRLRWVKCLSLGHTTISYRTGFSPGFSDSNTFALSCYYTIMLAAVCTTRVCLVYGAKSKQMFFIVCIAQLGKLLKHVLDAWASFLLSENMLAFPLLKPRVSGCSFHLCLSSQHNQGWPWAKLNSDAQLSQLLFPRSPSYQRTSNTKETTGVHSF